MKILVIDDSQTIREGLRKSLTEAGHLVEEAQYFGSIPRIVNDFDPDVVLLDIEMPAVNGEDVGLVLNRSFPDLRIVLHSSAPLKEIIRVAGSVKVHGWLSKGEDVVEYLEQEIRDW